MPRMVLSQKKRLNQLIFKLLLGGVFLVAFGAHDLQHFAEGRLEQESGCVVCLGFASAAPKLFTTDIAVKPPQATAVIAREKAWQKGADFRIHLFSAPPRGPPV